MKKTKKIALLTIGALGLLGSVVAATAVACNNNKSNSGSQTSNQNTVSSLLLGSEIAKTPASTATPTKGADYVVELNDENSEFMNFFIDPYKAVELFAKNLDANGYSITTHAPLKDKGFTTFEAYAKDASNKVRTYVRAVANLPTIKKLRDANTTILFAETTQAFNTTNASLLDKYYYQQPDLFPFLYSTPEHEVPGFGLKFPKPVDHKSDMYFDNWHGIGASQNYASSSNNGNDAWRSGLYKSYYQTADYMVYNYDSNKLQSGTKKEDFEKFFKEQVKNDKIILSDFQMGYAGIWGLIGQVELATSFAKALGATDAELKTVENLKWTPEKAVHIRPQNQTGEKVKLATNFYSLWDHLLSLGIAPDYSSFNNEKGATYPKVAGVFNKYFDPNLTEFKDFRGKADVISSMNLYALAINTSHIASHKYKEYIGENKEIKKTIETERGDSDNTRSATEFKFYNRKENKLETAKPSAGKEGKFSSYQKPATNSGSH